MIGVTTGVTRSVDYSSYTVRQTCVRGLGMRGCVSDLYPGAQSFS